MNGDEARRPAGAPEVTIGVITCRRPRGLARLLDSLNRLEFTRSPIPRIEVLVVDNDAEPTAGAVCRRFEGGFRWHLRYAHQPRPGIPFARNTVFRLARPAADFIAFVDDDETVRPDWLDRLLETQAAYQADVVTGPTLPEFDRPPPRWARDGPFFQPPKRYATGTPVRSAYTGNILYRADLVRRSGLQFDERMAQTGGSDIHQTRRIRAAGYTIVWCDQAVTCEWWPESRVAVGWLCRRAFRYGASWAFVDFDLLPPGRALGKTAFGAVERGVKGAFDLLASPFAGKPRAIRGLMRLCAASGMALGIFGVRYHEYRRIHGD